MQDSVLVPEGAGVHSTAPLSQAERVIDTFIAPAKTFSDILRSTSWWLPFLLAVVLSAASAFAVDHKVGFDRVAENNIASSPKAEERMAQLPPEQRATQMRISAVVTKDISYGAGIFYLIFVGLFALLNWATLNFGLGAKTTFGQNFAVQMYAALPRMLVSVLNIIFVYTGVNTESFDLKNPVGTNLGYYFPDAAPMLKAALTSLDVFGLWSLALTVLGLAIIARKPIGQAAMVGIGWWLVVVLLSVGGAAFS